MEAMKKQTESLNKECDCLLQEHQKLQVFQMFQMFFPPNLALNVYTILGTTVYFVMLQTKTETTQYYASSGRTVQDCKTNTRVTVQ